MTGKKKISIDHTPDLKFVLSFFILSCHCLNLADWRAWGDVRRLGALIFHFMDDPLVCVQGCVHEEMREDGNQKYS